MATRQYFILTLAAILCIVLFSACPRDCDARYGEGRVILILPIKMYPVQDTFYVGDTIWVEIDFNKELQVRNYADKLKFENQDFALSFWMGKQSDTITTYSSSYVEIVPHTGSVAVLPSGLTGLVSYPITLIETEDRYLFKMGAVLKEAGLFRSSIESHLDDRELRHPMLTRCENGKGGSIRRGVFILTDNELASDDSAHYIIEQLEILFSRELENPFSDLYGGLGFRVLER